jgi:RHS repeat-associated protein
LKFASRSPFLTVGGKRQLPITAISPSEVAIKSGAWQQTYDVDRFGNRAVRATSYIPNPQLTPQSASLTDFSAFDQSNNRLSMTKYPQVLYDGAGNLKRDQAGSAFTYDGENRQLTASVGSTSASYFYDGDGRRVKKVVGTVTTVFVYNASGQMVAEYVNDPVPPPAGGGGTSYLTSDHLGSTRVVTRQDGSVKARYDYLPFGEELPASIGGRSSVAGYGSADSTRQKFTSKERDSESGLDYFLARYYSSAHGRFTSPDEFTGGPDEVFGFAATASGNPTFYADIVDPQTLNKYQYCLNNPFKYIDPDGHQEKSLTQRLKESLQALFEAKGGGRFHDSDNNAQDNPTDPYNKVYGRGTPQQAHENVNKGWDQAAYAYDQLAKLYEMAAPGSANFAGTLMKYQHGNATGNDLLWAAAGLNFASPLKAFGHFKQHAIEWGFGKFNNAVDYVLGARALITSTSRDVVRYRNAAGKILVYNKATNELATHTGNTIHTFFKPEKGEAYVNRVIKRDGYKPF